MKSKPSIGTEIKNKLNLHVICFVVGLIFYELECRASEVRFMISANSSHHSSAGSHLCIPLAERERTFIVTAACVCMRPGYQKLLRRVIQCWIHCLGLFFFFFVRVCNRDDCRPVPPQPVILQSDSALPPAFRCSAAYSYYITLTLLVVCVKLGQEKGKYVTGHLITRRECTRLCVCAAAANQMSHDEGSYRVLLLPLTRIIVLDLHMIACVCVDGMPSSHHSWWPNCNFYFCCCVNRRCDI